MPTAPPTTGGVAATSIPEEQVEPAQPTTCPDNVAPGTRCYRLRPDRDPAGARLPDGTIVALPPSLNVDVDTGASTSNDVDQVIIINNDNRVIGQEPFRSAVRQWVLATIGLLLLVLVAAATGAAIFRAGVRQGQGQGQ